MPDKCRGCDAEVKWILTVSGGKTLVNLPPEKRYIMVRGKGQMIDTYLSHFATCPKSSTFKKKKTE